MKTELTKTCTTCGQVLPATPHYFGVHKTGKYGVNAKCKACTREYMMQAKQRARGDIYYVGDAPCVKFKAIDHGHYTTHQTTRGSTVFEFH